MDEIVLLSRSEIETIIKETALAVVENLRNDLQRPANGWTDKAGIAEHIGRSPSTINRYMTSGMPFEKIGDGHPRFRKSDVDRWLYERVQTLQGKAD